MGKYNEQLPTDDLTPEQLLAIAVETALKIRWRIKFTSDAGFVAYTENGGHAWNGEITFKIDDFKANIECVSIGGELNDWGRNKDTVQRFLKDFSLLKSVFTKEELHQKYKKLEKEFVPAYEDPLKPVVNRPIQNLNGFFSFFKPAKDYYITPILINLNLLIFIIMVATGINVFKPATESMIIWGANIKTLTLEGQWWRLLSSCFIHFGIFHIVLNMFALAFIGSWLEPYLGKVKFIIAYLLTGIAASLASLWWHDFTISAGASGAIFGLMGIFIAMLTTKLIEPDLRKGLLTYVSLYAGYSLINGLLKGGVDNAAHIGGLLSGILIGYAYVPGLKKPNRQQLNRLSTVAVVVITVLASALTYSALSKSDTFIYEKGMRKFYDLEKASLEYYHISNDTTTSAKLFILKNHGIVYWERNAKLIKQLDQLDLSDNIHIRNNKLIRYCGLRIRSYQLTYKKIEESTDKYDRELTVIEREIVDIIKDITSKK